MHKNWVKLIITLKSLKSNSLNFEILKMALKYVKTVLNILKLFKQRL